MSTLDVAIRTPSTIVYSGPADSVRVPTETGLVGLRPNGEPMVLAIEAGLVVIRTGDREELAATAGGLLESNHARVVLYTPYAVVGDSRAELKAALEALLASSPTEIVSRQRLEQLEHRIVTELAQRARKAPAEPHHG